MVVRICTCAALVVAMTVAGCGSGNSGDGSKKDASNYADAMSEIVAADSDGGTETVERDPCKGEYGSCGWNGDQYCPCPEGTYCAGSRGDPDSGPYGHCVSQSEYCDDRRGSSIECGFAWSPDAEFGEPPYCGDCPEGQVCIVNYNYPWQNHCCEPQCEDGDMGPACGDNGCGGNCGECDEGFMCGSTQDRGGQIAKACLPTCAAWCNQQSFECGTHAAIGPTDTANGVCLCGECPAGDTCTDAGTCCTPDCDGKECGDDGCGGVCGWCESGHGCKSDHCLPSGLECLDVAAGDEDGCVDGLIVPKLLRGGKYHEVLADVDVAAVGESSFVGLVALSHDICALSHDDIDTDEGCIHEGSSAAARVYHFGVGPPAEYEIAYGADWSGGALPYAVSAVGSMAGSLSLSWLSLGADSDATDSIELRLFEHYLSPPVESCCSIYLAPTAPHLGLGKDGETVVFWSGGTASEPVYAAIYDVEGQTPSSPNVLPISTTGNVGHIATARLEGGGIVLAWLEFSDPPMIVAQRVSDALVPIGSPSQGVPVDSNSVRPQVVGLGAGGFALTWTTEESVGLSCFEDDGTSMHGLEFTRKAHSARGAGLAPFSDSSVVWAYVRDHDPGGQSLVVEALDCEGNAKWEPAVFGGQPMDGIGRFSVAASPSNLVGVFWERAISCDTNESPCTSNPEHEDLRMLYGTVLNPAGQLVSGLCNNGICDPEEDGLLCPKDCAP